MARLKRGRKDDNHNAMKMAFEHMGCSVVDLYDAGIAGLPDLIVGMAGTTLIVEVKNPDTNYGRAGLNANQSAFARDWRGAPVRVVTCVQDVVQLVNATRRGGATAGGSAQPA